jgi:hypothetical protein
MRWISWLIKIGSNWFIQILTSWMCITLLRNYGSCEHNYGMLGARSKLESPCAWFMHPTIIFSRPTWQTHIAEKCYVILLWWITIFFHATNPNPMHQHQYWPNQMCINMLLTQMLCHVQEYASYDETYMCINVLLTSGR